MYYNTLKLKGKDLELARENAKSQEDFIKWVFDNESDLQITPSQMNELYGNNTPITSIRRAITNLTNSDYLEKTDIQVMGIYGKPEHVWKKKIKTQLYNKFF